MERLDVVVVCEAYADLVTACDLADRVIVDDVDWVEPEHLPHLRRWRGLGEQDAFIPWMRVDKLAREHGLPPQFGHFGGVPGEIDARTARNALRLLKHLKLDVGGVLLIRDADNQAEQRRRGLEQARASSPLGTVPVVIGLPITKRECWVLAAFDPIDATEQELLEAARRELGYDPRLHPERLSASDETAKNNAKRILLTLCLGGDRGTECCRTASLRLLMQRGTESGLTGYLEEVRDRIVPLLRGTQRV